MSSATIAQREAAKKIPLTPNQLILLLQIYRGLLSNTHIITEESYIKDMKYLIAQKLIEHNPDNLYYRVTPAGTLRVMHVLEPDNS